MTVCNYSNTVTVFEINIQHHKRAQTLLAGRIVIHTQFCRVCYQTLCDQCNIEYKIKEGRRIVKNLPGLAYAYAYVPTLIRFD